MKNWIYIWLLFVLGWEARAQTPPTSKEKIEAVKIGFITERLNLSKDQAKEFWPVYEEYTDKRKDIKKEIKKLRIETTTGGLDDNELLTELRKVQQLKQQELNLEKEYFDKFLKMLSAKQVAELYRAEKDFTKLLLQKLGDR